MTSPNAKEGWLLLERCTSPNSSSSSQTTTAKAYVVVSESGEFKVYEKPKAPKPLISLNLSAKPTTTPNSSNASYGGDAQTPISVTSDIKFGSSWGFVVSTHKNVRFVARSVTEYCAWVDLLSSFPNVKGPTYGAFTGTHANCEIINKFYTAFSKHDWKTMGDSYLDEATFSDTVFPNLNAHEARSMWEMLLSGNNSLKLEFSKVSANSTFGMAHWVATYSFSATGNLVVNRIDATFQFKDGKIQHHKDVFDFYNWSSMALGGLGKLLGWTDALQKKVQGQAAEKLTAFLAKKASASTTATTTTTTTATTTATTTTNTTLSSTPSKTIIYTERFPFPAAKVWALVKNWENPLWTGVIKSASCVPAVDAQNPAKKGNVRTIVFYSNESRQYHDELVELDDNNYHMEWKQVNSPLPIKNHMSSLTLTPEQISPKQQTEEQEGQQQQQQEACYFEWSHSYDVASDVSPDNAAYVDSAFFNLQKAVANSIRNIILNNN